MAQDETEKTQAETKEGAKKGKWVWPILVAIVMLCAGSGFFLGKLFAGFHVVPDEAGQPFQEAAGQGGAGGDENGGPQETWYYEMDPVVANLDEPGVTRYVRATLTLEMSAKLPQAAGTQFLEEKKPVLTNWLTIYLASLSLGDTRGERNLKRIQSQMVDVFNEVLFPDQAPKIKHILFKEFAIQ